MSVEALKVIAGEYGYNPEIVTVCGDNPDCFHVSLGARFNKNRHYNFTQAVDLIVCWEREEQLFIEHDTAQEKVEQQAEIIRHKNQEIERFRAYSTMLENANKAAFGMLRRVMNSLSLQTVLQNTHKERNEALRSIVQQIHYLTTKPVDEFQEPSKDMDDIPF